MGKGREPYWSDGNNIKCCKDCVPPKRYPGCGANCKEYKEAKAQFEADKEKMRAKKGFVLGKHDFDMLQPKSERRKRKT